MTKTAPAEDTPAIAVHKWVLSLPFVYDKGSGELPRPQAAMLRLALELFSERIPGFHSVGTLRRGAVDQLSARKALVVAPELQRRGTVRLRAELAAGDTAARLNLQAPGKGDCVAGGPIRSHSTDTSTKAWTGSRMETKLGDAPAKVLRKAYAWADPEGDPNAKGSYKFIHHEIARGGEVGPANIRACTNGIAVLNGARGGADIPTKDRKGIYNHLAKHLRDGGEEPASLK